MPLSSPSVPETPHTSRLAIASLASGLYSNFWFSLLLVAIAGDIRKSQVGQLEGLAFTGTLVAPLFTILAVVLGYVALQQIRKSAGRQQGTGMARAGLTLGFLSTVSIPLTLLSTMPSFHL